MLKFFKHIYYAITLRRFIGKIVYRVYAFPERGDKNYWVETYFVKDIKFHPMVNSWFMTVQRQTDEGKWYSWDDETSFKDANVIPNCYNCHRLFTSKAEAQAYVDDPTQWKPKKKEERHGHI